MTTASASHRLLNFVQSALLRGADEPVPFRHVGALFHYVEPSGMVLAAGILQRVVLEPEADFLRDPRLAGHRLECPAQVLASNLARKTSTKHRAIHLPASRSDAAISLIERNRTSSSSLVGSNPRRRQNSAASPSTALTINARPPISDAA